MHQRTLRGPFRAALVIVILTLAVAAASANACTGGTLTDGSTFGTTTCPTMSGPNFQQSGFCFYFPNGSTTPLALCDPSSCGLVTFLLPASGTFTATLTYPSPNGFTQLGLQLCHNGQLPTGDPATCPEVMAPGGADVPGCAQEFTPGDNGTPLDPTDDTMTTTLTCPIPVGDSVNQYTLIVFPMAVLNCADPSDIVCAADFTNGVTAALSGSFSSILVSPGPADAKAEGGGEVATRQHFALHAKNDPSKWDHTRVRFAIANNDATRCTFSADGATFVDIEPDPMAKSGGTAYITGTGTVTDWLKMKHTVTYQLHITDGGQGGTDTFQLSATGCDTNGLPAPVTHGQINIKNSHDND